MNLGESDLDSDWQYIDNVREVTLYIRGEDDELGDPQIVDALDSAFEVNENYEMQDAGDDAGEVYNNTATYALRKSQITGGKVSPGSKVVDWDGKTWWVRYSKYKSWDSRVMVILQQNKV